MRKAEKAKPGKKEKFPAEEEIYKENILEHYRHPRHQGILKKYTLKRKEANPLCGDVITIYLKLKEKRIGQASFTGQGCAISQAAASLLMEKIQGLSLSQIQREVNEEKVFALLGIPISLPRRDCALLALKALKNCFGEMNDKKFPKKEISQFITQSYKQ